MQNKLPLANIICYRQNENELLGILHHSTYRNLGLVEPTNSGLAVGACILMRMTLQTLKKRTQRTLKSLNQLKYESTVL